MSNVVYLMRGLPSCGKSHMARRLAGPDGIVLETDAYFAQHRVDQCPRAELLRAARAWNFQRFQRALANGRSPIVVDRGNGLTLETYRYTRLALDHGYAVELREPDSAWWQELRVLLKYKQYTKPVLDAWAEELAARNASTHGVPVSDIRQFMEAWQAELTIEDILRFGEAAGS